MDLLNRFIEHLLSKNKHSRITVKNYKADICHFIRWFEAYFKRQFNPSLVTPQIIETYKNSNTGISDKIQQDVYSDKSISIKTLKRHLSSLRSFFSFLKIEEIVKYNPLELASTSNTKNDSDTWGIKSFKNYLYVCNSSDLTIKNYINDIKQFLSWAQNVTRIKDAWDIREKNLFEKIDLSLIEEYKNRLLENNISAQSINRKLSSIRKYTKWALEEGLIKKNQFISVQNIDSQSKFQKPALSAILKTAEDQSEDSNYSSPEIKPNYSVFPPFRFVQKIINALIVILDIILIIPLINISQKKQHLFWKIKGKPLFKKLSYQKELFERKHIKTDPVFNISNINKSFYAPLKISTKYFPLHKKLLFHLYHTRPKWYRNYHSYPITHYFHFGVLVIFMSIIGFSIYTSFIKNPQSKNPALASPLTTRVLAFQGRLTDSLNNPEVTAKNIRFSIYNDSTSSGSALLWNDTKNVTPDNNGVFSVKLGDVTNGGTPLAQRIFTDNPSLFLGITVGTDAEFAPRQHLTNVSYASDSETLQGLTPITKPGAGTKNVILALDSSGNLIMGETTSTTFQAMDGQFKLSGQLLFLTTNIDSGGDVQISPDGLGKIDLQKPLQNTTNNNNLSDAIGSVEVDDTFSILATSSAQSALTINQNDIGPLISASTSGYAKFTVDNSGRGYLANGIGIGTTNSQFKVQVAGDIGPNSDLLFNLGSSSARWNKAYINELIGAETGKIGFWQRNENGITPSTQTDALNLGSSTSASIRIAGKIGENSFFNNEGNLGIGTTNPSEKLDIDGNATISGSLVLYGKEATIAARSMNNLNLGDSQTGNLILDPKGNVGIGTKNPGYKLQVGEAGDGTEARANAWNSLSDIRLKENIKALSGSLEKVLALSGVSFNWKKTGIASIGFIAQEVEKIAPELVSTGNDGYKSLDYSKITPLLTQAIKEQQAQITSLVEKTQNLAAKANSIFSADKIISPIAEINQIHTNIISPLGNDSNIIVKLASSNQKENQPKLIVQNSAGSDVTTIDSAGNVHAEGNLSAQSASFSGQLNADQASIAGTLRADRIIANDIEGLSTKIASFAATQQYNNGAVEQLSDTDNFSANFAKFTQGLISLGPSSLSDTTVNGQFSIGPSSAGGLILEENSINVFGRDLELQPLRQGGVSFLGGKVYIDSEGNLKMDGNADFAKDVNIKGVLSTSVIAPVPDSDLVIKLGNNESGIMNNGNHNSSFIIHNSSDSAVMEVNSDGNLTASGSGKFNEILTNAFNIVRGAQADTSFTETIASSSAGTATIVVGETERTITTPYIKENSLIYITPVSDTQGITPYIARQTTNSFTIQIPQRANKDINLNWWIVN
ncbi:MAG: site-specific integrase [Candidatus Levybacteria bacterium]|nr:site-specific integrase [Candidatus Levybacteria bacterium]